MKKRSRTALRAAALAGAVLLGACVGDADELLQPVEPATGGALFQRYVSLGNSITQGYQSGGINDSLQVRAYPVLLAGKANAGFTSPLVARPGCPRPFLAPLGATGRLGTADSCFRINAPAVIQNVAVPGERLADLLRFPSGDVARLHILLLGERTQVRHMIDARPSFVSVWIGNNDALEATVSGVLGPQAAGADSSLTQLSRFQTNVGLLADSIAFAAPQGAMLIGVVNAIRAAPIVQPGAFFYLAAQTTGGVFQGKQVNVNCSPVTSLGQPNPLSANMVSFQILGDARFTEINCDPNAYADARRGVYLLDTTEQAIVTARVNAFNAAIKAAADARGWLYVDPNVLLEDYRGRKATNGRYTFVRKCQDLATATTAAQFQTAVLNSCPVTGATGEANLFGSLFSFDGVHPSTSAHVIIANSFATAINAKYNISLPTT